MDSCVLLAPTGDWRAVTYIRAALTPSLGLSLVQKPRISSLFYLPLPNCSSPSEKSPLSLHPVALPPKEGNITANLFGGPTAQDAHAACMIFLCWLSIISFILHSNIDRKVPLLSPFYSWETEGIGEIIWVSLGHYNSSPGLLVLNTSLFAPWWTQEAFRKHVLLQHRNLHY